MPGLLRLLLPSQRVLLEKHLDVTGTQTCTRFRPTALWDRLLSLDGCACLILFPPLIPPPSLEFFHVFSFTFMPKTPLFHFKVSLFSLNNQRNVYLPLNNTSIVQMAFFQGSHSAWHAKMYGAREQPHVQSTNSNATPPALFAPVANDAVTFSCCMYSCGLLYPHLLNRVRALTHN